jgi:hypothetical protein
VYVFDRGSAGHWLIKAVLRGSSGPSTSSFGQSLGLLFSDFSFGKPEPAPVRFGQVRAWPVQPGEQSSRWRSLPQT